MPDWIIPLESAIPISLVGRKAAALGRLIEARFPIPPSVCITTDVFNTAVRSRHGELQLPDGLLESLTPLLPKDIPLAVRSSAVQEDTPESSFAGRYSTHLNVMGMAALEKAILDCWQSYFPVSASRDGGMAVLIQPLVEAECAGVCFTVDPVHLQPATLLITAGWGLGAGVVSGSVPTDTIRLRRRDLGTEDVSIAYKHTALRASPSGEVVPVPLSSELCNIPCLPDDWLQRIGEYGLTIEQVFGMPQDIEWAIADGKVWILQSRPITALPVEVCNAVRYPIQWENAEEPRHYWWLQQTGDSAGSPLLPALLDMTRQSIQGGHDAVYFGGINQTRWRKEVNGRAYWTVASAPHSPGHSRVYRAALLELYERLRQQDVTPWEYWGPEVINATERLAAFNPSEADGQALADHLEDAIATSIRHWMQHTIGPGRPIRDSALLEAYARLAGQQPENAASEIPFLLTGIETIQTRLVESLYDLACMALEIPDEAKEIVLGQVEYSETSSLQGNFAIGYQQFIAAYGDRLCYQTIPGYPVEIPLPWREVPEHVWEMISAYLPLARQGGPSLRDVRLQTKEALDQRIESLCATALQAGTDPAIVEDFRRKWSYARRNAFSLDEHNHYIDQLSEGQFIQALLHAGRWLAAHGSIPGPYDVFWLNSDEVIAALRGASNCLEEIIASRRVQFSEWQSLIPPARLGLPTPELPDRPAIPVDLNHETPASVSTAANHLRGEPASRGHASGRAHIIDGEGLPAEIDPGAILIAPFASPVLIPLLPAVTAVVLDYGGPGDHFAITAREFGLPAVCGTLHATRMIPEGAMVTVDAGAGFVTWEE